MKRKLFAGGVLVVICLSVLVVQGVSQPPKVPSLTPISSPAPPSPASSSPSPRPVSRANFAKVDPLLEGRPQEAQTFEQLADALQAVRARQKELKAQESDLLAKMAEKIEEKRKDLKKAEETLQQLQGEPNRLNPPNKAEEKKVYNR